MSIFEIMGPAMIGPSSSHTAGAARIGRMARLLFADKIDRAVVKLHGSFADTAVGHGTDRAIIGGLLGFLPDDERLRGSFELADKQGMEFSLEEVKLREVHPNTAKIELYNKENNKKLEIVASSIGGGRIKVTEINGSPVELTGRMPTLWILHHERQQKHFSLHRGPQPTRPQDHRQAPAYFLKPWQKQQLPFWEYHL